ncbi:MAG: hypothetical protein M0Z95_24375 [Actinomycetota bacterium]|nr:hypothetical protein [Actinomycetota bacterium]
MGKKTVHSSAAGYQLGQLDETGEVERHPAGGGHDEGIRPGRPRRSTPPAD